MSFFKLRRKASDIEPEKEYTIDSDGLKKIAHGISGYSFDIYNYPSEVESDVSYLLGVADTLPNSKRMEEITVKIMSISYLVAASFSIKEIKGDL